MAKAWRCENVCYVCRTSRSERCLGMGLGTQIQSLFWVRAQHPQVVFQSSQDGVGGTCGGLLHPPTHSLRCPFFYFGQPGQEPGCLHPYELSLQN